MSKSIESQVEEFTKETLLFKVKVGEGDIEKMARLQNLFIEALQEHGEAVRKQIVAGIMNDPELPMPRTREVAWILKKLNDKKL